MTAEYNLIILGGNPVACYAAQYARQLNARVALVVPAAWANAASGAWDAYGCGLGLTFMQHLGTAAHLRCHGPFDMGDRLWPDAPGSAMSAALPSDFSRPALGAMSSSRPWLQGTDALSFTQTMVEGQADWRSPTALASLGIDVVYGDGEFIPQDQGVEVAVGSRSLRSYGALIALDGEPLIPPIAGLEQVPHSTLHTFLQRDPDAPLPRSLLLISNTPQGIESAQGLAALGIAVTLVLPQSMLLPGADERVNDWLWHQLQGVGVTVVLGTTVTQLRPEAGGPCVATLVQEGQPETLCTTDEVLLVMGRQVDFAAWNLAAVGVKYTPDGIEVSDRYQSSCPRIFACGDAIPHRVPSSLALHQYRAEALAAVQTCLFQGPLLSLLLRWLCPLPRPHPRSIPLRLGTQPPLAWVGLSAAEATQRYGDRIRIYHYSWLSSDQAQLLNAQWPDATSGFCQVIALDNGQLVGVWIAGVEAHSLIHPFALALQQSIPLQEVGLLYPPLPGLMADLLQSLMEQWRRDRCQHRTRLFDGLELAFNWQRDWTR